jgi:dihydropyrimidinase
LRYGPTETLEQGVDYWKHDEGKSMLDLTIENGTLVMPRDGLIHADVGVKDGKICMIGNKSWFPTARQKVDASEKFVLPGLFDPHVHLGGRTSFENEVLTETKSALSGGITTVGCFLRRPESYISCFGEYLETAERLSYTDILFHLTILTEEQLEEIPVYASKLGVTSFKIYMCGKPHVADTEDWFIFNVFKEVAKLGPPAITCIHAENASLVGRAMDEVLQKKPDGTLADWAESHPHIGEEEAVIRTAFFAEKAKARVYIVHVNTAEAVERLREIKQTVKNIFAETSSFYLSMDKNDEIGLWAKKNPPLRDRRDVEALWEGVTEDVIDTFGTDNVSADKAGNKGDTSLLEAKGGFPLLATNLPVLLHEGYHKRKVPLEKIVEKLSVAPARIFGIYPQKGSIQVGSDADLVIVDLEKEKVVNWRELHSFADFSIYDGRKLKGWPVMTIKGGEIVAEDYAIKAKPGVGKYIRRRI